MSAECNADTKKLPEKRSERIVIKTKGSGTEDKASGDMYNLWDTRKGCVPYQQDGTHLGGLLPPAGVQWTTSIP